VAAWPEVDVPGVAAVDVEEVESEDELVDVLESVEESVEEVADVLVADDVPEEVVVDELFEEPLESALADVAVNVLAAMPVPSPRNAATLSAPAASRERAAAWRRRFRRGPRLGPKVLRGTDPVPAAAGEVVVTGSLLSRVVVCIGAMLRGGPHANLCRP
jgi:hypothetical protein